MVKDGVKKIKGNWNYRLKIWRLWLIIMNSSWKNYNKIKPSIRY